MTQTGTAAETTATYRIVKVSFDQGNRAKVTTLETVTEDAATERRAYWHSQMDPNRCEWVEVKGL